MSLNHYVVGNRVSLVARFAVVDPLTDAQTPTDPTTVVFRRVLPDSTVQVFTVPDPAVTNPDTGVFVCQVNVDMAGRERWRVEGVGACKAAFEDAFDVDASRVI